MAVDFGHYQIISELGRGRWSVVHQALDVRNKRMVAIKQLVITPAEESRKQILIERFRRRARETAKLTHANIVPVVEFGWGTAPLTDNDIAEQNFYVMELMDGRTLSYAQAMKGGRLPIEELLVVFKHAAQALAFAHSKNLVHCNLKPSNIFLLKSNQVRISDFGFAFSSHFDEADIKSVEMLMSALPYLAPEQFQEEQTVDLRADVYSLAAIMYEAISGKSPFKSEGVASTIVKITTSEPTPLTVLMPSIRSRTAAVIARALAKQPGDRYPSVAQFFGEFVESIPGINAVDYGISLPEQPAGKQAASSEDEIWGRMHSAGRHEAGQGAYAEGGFSGGQSAGPGEYNRRQQAPSGPGDPFVPTGRGPNLFSGASNVSGAAAAEELPGDPLSAGPPRPGKRNASDNPLGTTARLINLQDALQKHIVQQSNEVDPNRAPFQRDTNPDLSSEAAASARQAQVFQAGEPFIPPKPGAGGAEIYMSNKPAGMSRMGQPGEVYQSGEPLMMPKKAAGKTPEPAPEVDELSDMFNDKYKVAPGVVSKGKEYLRPLRVFGKAGEGKGGMLQPTAVASTLGAVVVGDSANGNLQVFSRDGRWLFAAKPNLDDKNSKTCGQLSSVSGIACDTRNRIFVCDSTDHYVRVFDSRGVFLREIFNKKGRQGGLQGIACDSTGLVYLSDPDNSCVQVIDSERGAFIRQLSFKGGSSGQLQFPAGIAIDSANNIYVVDYGSSRVAVFSRSGELLRTFGAKGKGPGQFNVPRGIALDKRGLVYVADTLNHRIQIFSQDGTWLSSFGSRGSSEGVGFSGPAGICIDQRDDILFVADRGNQRIQLLSILPD